MLDVHLPHKLHGFWEFLLHLFTITVGLLIATQIESCVEWRHHVHLAEEARVELRAEIVNNLKQLKEHEPEVKKFRQRNESDLVILRLIQQHQKVPKEQLNQFGVSTGSVSLSDTAWKTAQTTGALAFMPYAEAEEYASIYQAQSSLLAVEEKPADEFRALIGLMAKFHLHHIGDMTSEQADDFAENLGRMRAQMAEADTQLQNTIEKISAFLEHRKARPELETKVN
jgi:methyl-accepting chemotaxis protein